MGQEVHQHVSISPPAHHYQEQAKNHWAKWGREQGGVVSRSPTKIQERNAKDLRSVVFKCSVFKYSSKSVKNRKTCRCPD
jgi:hypothetical protein